jgi:glycosyltransferase involved in cell wall biosynthesis
LTTRRARYYPVARLAHLERLTSESTVDFLFEEHRADWDEALAASLPQVHHLTFVRVLKKVWNAEYDVIEIPEPLAVALLPRLIALTAVLNAKNAFRSRRSRFVTYAIENLDQAAKVKSMTRIPYWIARLLIRLSLRLIFRNVSRIAFGTEGARANYEDATGPSWSTIQKRTQTELFIALPAASGLLGPRSPLAACFVGSLDDRKGIQDLLLAWPMVVRDHPGASMSILGHGPLEALVQEFASNRREVHFEADPPRERIWEVLRASHCLVLPSRRTPKWREQVGLPIIEALSVGCEIVTTAETGIADWLLKNGHQVIENPDQQALARSIGIALISRRPSSDILNSLPLLDTRAAADVWMFSGLAKN